MKLIDALDLECPKTIALVGAGGKTSFIFTLAGEAAGRQKSVLITTTTAMFKPAYPDSGNPCPLPASGQARGRMFIGPARYLRDRATEPGTILVAAPALTARGQKLAGYSPLDLSPVLRSPNFDLILIEADGARMRPVKAPAAHEPVIPEQTDMVAGCIGLDCLGRPLAAPHVHRPEILAALSGQQHNTPVTSRTLALLARSKRGLFKSACPDMAKTIVLNKADSPRDIEQGKALAQTLVPGSLADLCLVTCFLNPENPVIHKQAHIHLQN